jgi:hypothetical protein
MSQSPSPQVLQIPELVANILIHLSPRDLLLSARLVNRTWHEIIISTPSLQESLFLRASSRPASLRLNLLLKDAFPIYFRNDGNYFGSEAMAAMPWSKNPAAFKRKNASWRPMLLWNGGELGRRQLKLRSRSQFMRGTFEKIGTISFPHELRMGDLWDLTYQHCRDDKTIFRICWGGVSKEASNGSADEDLLELAFSSFMNCEARDWRVPPILGPDFQSDGFVDRRADEVYGEAIQVNQFNGLATGGFRRNSASGGFWGGLLRSILSL